MHFANQLSPELWFCTGTAKQRTYVAVHSINIDQALSKTSSVSRTYWVRHRQSVVWNWKNNGLEDIHRHYSLLDGLRHETQWWNAGKCQRVHLSVILGLWNWHKDQRCSVQTLQQRFKRPWSYLRPSLRCNNTSSEHTTSVLSGIHQWLRMAGTKILPQDKRYLHLLTEEPFSGEYLQPTQCQCKNCASTRCQYRSKKLRCTAGCGCSDGTYRNPFNKVDVLHVRLTELYAAHQNLRFPPNRTLPPNQYQYLGRLW